MALDDLGEIRADVVEIDSGRGRGHHHRRGLAFDDGNQQVARHHRVADLDTDPVHHGRRAPPR